VLSAHEYSASLASPTCRRTQTAIGTRKQRRGTGSNWLGREESWIRDARGVLSQMTWQRCRFRRPLEGWLVCLASSTSGLPVNVRAGLDLAGIADRRILQSEHGLSDRVFPVGTLGRTKEKG